jgi:hypothetical protein
MLFLRIFSFFIIVVVFIKIIIFISVIRCGLLRERVRDLVAPDDLTRIDAEVDVIVLGTQELVPAIESPVPVVEATINRER